jgi:hypothetical protein
MSEIPVCQCSFFYFCRSRQLPPRFWWRDGTGCSGHWNCQLDGIGCHVSLSKIGSVSFYCLRPISKVSAEGLESIFDPHPPSLPTLLKSIHIRPPMTQLYDNDICDMSDTCHKCDTHNLCHTETHCDTWKIEKKNVQRADAFSCAWWRRSSDGRVIVPRNCA